MYREEFEVRSVWIAAYLHLFGVKLLRVVPLESRRSRFYFKNDENRASQLLDEWHNEHDAQVNGPAYMRSYHEMLSRARAAEYERDNRATRDSRDSHDTATANGDYYDTGYGRPCN
jgi:hypothetical protein